MTDGQRCTYCDAPFLPGLTPTGRRERSQYCSPCRADARERAIQRNTDQAEREFAARRRVAR
jgi:hypothetical protein